MRRVTLNGIKRKGLADWKGREFWKDRKVRIWSAEHSAWWRSEAAGYSRQIEGAGIYDFADAYDHTKHCGPEKRIVFYLLS